MGGLFKKPKMPEPPKPVRMVQPTDPDVEKRKLAIRRRDYARGTQGGGGEETILSDVLRQEAGGQKLGG